MERMGHEAPSTPTHSGTLESVLPSLTEEADFSRKQWAVFQGKGNYAEPLLRSVA